MRGVKGIVFDLDGTLVDTEPYHLEAWNSLVRRYGETPVAGWNDDTIGLPDTYAASKAKRLYPALSSVRGNLTDEKQSILRELIRREGRKLIFPGVEEGLRAAREAGIRLAVGTNSILLNADTTLGATGLREYFSAVVTIDLVQNGKPAPDIYARAVEELGLAPSECVVVEDSPAGVRAGKAAGCAVLGIESRYSEGRLGEADRVFSGTAGALSWILGLGSV